MNDSQSNAPLSALRVLVTRPQSQAGELIAALQSQGAEVIAFPLMVIEAIVGEAEQDLAAVQNIKQGVLNLDNYQHALFISTNAVHCAFAWIEQYWPQLPTGMSWYAIGSATAAALRQYGVQPHSAEGCMNSEILLKQSALQHLNGQKVIIFRGQGGRETLAETLTGRGARVDYCEVYRRRPLIHEQGALQHVLTDVGHNKRRLVLSVTSGETLAHLVDHAERAGILPCLKSLPLLVPGERVAKLAQERGFNSLLAAENAGVAAFCDALIRFVGEAAS